MNALTFLAGIILFGLLIAQLYRVYKADKEYQDLLQKYLREKEELEKIRNRKK